MHMSSGGHVCPTCGSTEIHRSSRVSWAVRLIPWMFRRMRLYRCEECWTRFWDRPASLSERTG